MRCSVRLPVALALIVAGANASAQTPAPPAPALAQQVEIRRTQFGVPHIRAQNLRAMAYGLAYAMAEDYGGSVVYGLLRSRGEMGKYFGKDSMEGDFTARLRLARARETYNQLRPETREVYEGWAAGVNRYVELHPEEFPPRFNPQFNGIDVASRDVTYATANDARQFLMRMDPTLRRRGRGPAAASSSSEGDEPMRDDARIEQVDSSAHSRRVDPSEDGSNAWAFAPSRTKSGKAILLRNPHLSWDAGYYEAHVTVPGVVDYYGDFRVGGPFGVVGGFNRDLGWSTTNNDVQLAEIYSLDVDTLRPDAYLFDGKSVTLERQLTTVEYQNGPGWSTETRESFRTPLGPVIWRGNGKIYVVKAAGDLDFHGGEQFLRMMLAHNLAEWKDAMRMRAKVNSNFTYADRAGNIYEVWNGTIPVLPHPSGFDTLAIPAHGIADVWTRYVPFDSLPQFLNPPGGYVHNENDPPYYGNMHAPLDRTRFPANFPEPRLGLRSQLAIELIDTKKKLSLEDVIGLKFSYKMLLADRVLPDLLSAVRQSNPSPAIAQGIDILSKWDRTSAVESRGGVLFETWWRKYIEGARADTMFATKWDPKQPTSTPKGILFTTRAVDAFAWAVDQVTRRYGSADVTWGDVHRARVNGQDVAIGGCNGDLGCFRVLWFAEQPDGKLSPTGGDGWILAVEFGNQPRAYSGLAYGESNRPGSTNYGDQLPMFARGELKKVPWMPSDVDAGTEKKYHPGESR